jgi:hypothetical protein
MNLRRLFNLALAAAVTAALAIAPLAAPVSAQARAGDMMDMSMSADVPCCPDKSGMDCQDCPLMAICVLQTVQASPPMAAALLLRYAIRTAHTVRNDALATGLDRPPPDQPPRSLI